MKTHLDIHHEGTVGTDELVRMTFDENSIAHLMSTLIDLYSDNELAVIREYSTNAADSHVAAGVTDPIEVETPTTLRQTFVVRDHGIGMNVDEITQQFSKYGWSSKRDTDDQVGMLGLGCKSALAYTSQFTFIAVKDGVRAVVLVTRDDDGCGALQVVDTCATSDPNGVEVSIPVSRAASFNVKVEEFFRFWPEASVLINGAPPSQTLPGSNDIVLDPDVFLTKRVDRDILVMGNVPYPNDHAKCLSNLRSEYRVVARVPIGSINFTPSREALQYTKRTEETMQTIREFVKDGLQAKVDKEINAAPNHFEAMKLATEYRDSLMWSVFKYRGVVIPEDFYRRPSKSKTVELVPFAGYKWSQPNGGGGTLSMFTPTLGTRALHVVGHPQSGMRDTTKKRIRKYIEDNNLDVLEPDAYGRKQHLTVLAYKELPAEYSPWMDDCLKVDYETIKAIEVDDGPKPIRQAKGKFRVVANGGEHEISFDDLANYPRPFFWETLQERKSRRHGGLRGRQVAGRGTIVIVSKTAIDRLLKAYPDSIHAKDMVTVVVQEYLDSLTDEDVYFMFHNGRHNRELARVPTNDLLDRDLATTITWMTTVGDPSASKLARWTDMNDLHDDYHGHALSQPKCELAAKLERANAAYPLIPIVVWRSESKKALVDYINALYLVREQVHLLPATY